MKNIEVKKIISPILSSDGAGVKLKRSIGVVPQETNFDPFLTPYESLDIQAGLYGVRKSNRNITKINTKLIYTLPYPYFIFVLGARSLDGVSWAMALTVHPKSPPKLNSNLKKQGSTP